MKDEAAGPLRIAYVLDTLAVGGAEKTLLGIAAEMARRGHEACVFFGGPDQLSATVAPLRTTFVRVHERHIGLGVRDPGSLRVPFRLAREFRERRIDAVHTALFASHFWAALAARALGIPCVRWVAASIYDEDRYDRFMRIPWVSWALQWPVARYITPAPYSTEECRRLRHIRPERLFENPLGVDLRPFDPELDPGPVRLSLGLPPGDPVMGYVGRLQPEKEWDIFFAVAREVHRKLPRARFLAVGDGALRGDLERLAVNYGLAERTTFTGWRSDVPRVMAAFDVTVQPMATPLVGSVTVESLAAARPVVAFDFAGIRSVVIDGETGVLIPGHDVSAMANAVVGLLEDPVRARELGRNGRRRAEAMFDERMHCDRMEKLYTALVMKAPGRLK